MPKKEESVSEADPVRAVTQAPSSLRPESNPALANLMAHSHCTEPGTGVGPVYREISTLPKNGGGSCFNVTKLPPSLEP